MSNLVTINTAQQAVAVTVGSGGDVGCKLDEAMIFRRDPKITFTTYPHLKDIIPDPVPARTVMPEWFKRLKPFVNDNPKDKDNKTVSTIH